MNIRLFGVNNHLSWYSNPFKWIKSFFCRHKWNEWEDCSFGGFDSAWAYRVCTKCKLTEKAEYQGRVAKARGFSGVFF